MTEMEDVIKKALKSVGHYTISACELDSEREQLAASMSNPSRTPIIANRIRAQERAVAEMNEKVTTQEKTAVQDIIEIAEKYRDLFSLGLVQVREGIEEAMAHFGSIISQDTLTQINKESAAVNARLSTFTEEQQKKLSAVADDMKLKIRHFDEKYDQLKATTDKHSKSVDRLSAANTNSIQNISNISAKLLEINKTQCELQGRLDNDLEQLDKRIDGYKSTMEKQTDGLVATARGDMERLSNKLNKAEELLACDKKTLEKYRTDFVNLRRQLMPLLRSTSTSSSSSSSSSSSTSPPKSPEIGSNDEDAKLIEIKSSMKQMEGKLNEVQQLVTFLVHNDESPTSKTVDKSAWDAVPKRLDDLEKYMIYLLSKVDVMEPQHQQIVTDMKSIANSPSFIDKRNDSPNRAMAGNTRTRTTSYSSSPSSPSAAFPSPSPSPALKTKRPLEVTSDTELTLLSEIKRVEFKVSNLVEFIYQFKSSILDPSFPEKLDNGFQQFEACLRNHEMFISYLVDPQATMQRITMDASSTDLASKEQSQQQPLKITPALLTTIAQFISGETHKSLQREMDKAASHQLKKQKLCDSQPNKEMTEYIEKQMKQMVAEQVDPLQKKIQDLEKQLQLKEQRK